MTADLGYYSTTKPDSLATSMTNTGTSVVLVDGSTFPDPALGGGKQYTVILGYGTDREEVCTVTAKPTSTTLTVIRGQDNTAATAKNAGDTVVHGVSAREFNSISTKLDKNGGTLTGPLVLQADPTAPLGAATKGYVDAGVGEAKAYADQAANDAMPIGSIIDYGGSVAPAGWHICDGTAHGSTALQSVIGSANTPDLRGRFVLGASASHPEKQTGGAETHTLTAAQSGLPAHSHTGSSGLQSADHVHSANPGPTGTSTESTYHSHGVTVSSGGSHVHQLHLLDAGANEAGDGNGFDSAPSSGWNNYAPNGETLAGQGTHGHTASAGNNTVLHTHTVDIPAFNTAGTSVNHNHSVTVNSNASAGAAQSHPIMPPFYALVKIIKKV
jgi:microcystin-dependent protein